MDTKTVFLVIGMIIGKIWREAGEQVELPENRAKELIKRGHASETPVDLAKKPAPTRKPAPPAAPDQPAGPDPTPSGNAAEDGQQTPLAEADITGKTAALLEAAGLTTVEAVQAYLAEGNKLEDLDGIGAATAKTILVALAN